MVNWFDLVELEWSGRQRKYKKHRSCVAMVCVAAARLSLSHMCGAAHIHMHVCAYGHPYMCTQHIAHTHTHTRIAWNECQRDSSKLRTHTRMHLENVLRTQRHLHTLIHIRTHAHTHTHTSNAKHFVFSRPKLNEMRNAKHKTVLVRTRNEIAHWTKGISRELTSKPKEKNLCFFFLCILLNTFKTETRILFQEKKTGNIVPQ